MRVGERELGLVYSCLCSCGTAKSTRDKQPGGGGLIPNDSAEEANKYWARPLRPDCNLGNLSKLNSEVLAGREFFKLNLCFADPHNHEIWIWVWVLGEKLKLAMQQLLKTLVKTRQSMLVQLGSGHLRITSGTTGNCRPARTSMGRLPASVATSGFCNQNFVC